MAKKLPKHRTPKGSTPQRSLPPPDYYGIRYPPQELDSTEPPDLFVPWFDDDLSDLFVRLRSIQKDYAETNNGIFLLLALTWCHESKLYPPMWVLQALTEISVRYLENAEYISLDRLLGLKPNRGKEPGYKAVARLARNKDIATDIWLLQHQFGLTVEEAAEVVCEKLSGTSRTKIRWGSTVRTLESSDAIAKLYSSEWKQQFKLSRERFEDTSKNFPPIFWRSFAEAFLKLPLTNHKILAKLQAK